MEIAGYSSIFGTQSADELEQVRRSQRSGSIFNKMSAENDTISFSKEGLRLAAEMKNGNATAASATSLMVTSASEATVTPASKSSGNVDSIKDSADIGTTAASALAGKSTKEITGETQDTAGDTSGGNGQNGGSGKSGGGGASSGSSSSATDIQAQIKSLSATLTTIMTSTMTNDAKQNAAAPIQQQIQVLEAQLSELQAQENKTA